jgi:succinyl-CoA synthetase beta subunit
MPPPVARLPARHAGPSAALDEAEAKALLARHGVTVPAGRRARDAEAAVAAAEALGFPVALKALGLPHKTEAGAVRLGLGSSAAVRAAAGDLLRLGRDLYVERMVTDAVAELIVGLTRDPPFDLVMTLGSGGVLVELLRDTASLPLPARRGEIEAALAGLRSAPLLDGFRGRARGDLAAALEAVEAVQRFALEHADSLVELDINPLIVCAEGHGAFAADALIVWREPPDA